MRATVSDEATRDALGEDYMPFAQVHSRTAPASIDLQPLDRLTLPCTLDSEGRTRRQARFAGVPLDRNDGTLEDYVGKSYLAQ
jgi:hypothetical protein